MARGQPPRNVPTLTEVVQRAPAPERTDDRADRLARDVLRRIGPDLDARLRESIAALIVQQTQALVPRLRMELEEMVRRAVVQALQDERPNG